MLKVKICGNRDPDSSRMVAKLGPDIMGWIFSPKSIRQIQISEAKSMIDEIHQAHPEINHWAVFAKNSQSEIEAVFNAIPLLSTAQIVADAEFCHDVKTSLGDAIDIVPAIRVQHRIRPHGLDAYPESPCFIMDAFVSGAYGGTGRKLDPVLLADIDRPYMLAGGLNALNVTDAIAACGTALKGVDVSSGVELDTPGCKDPAMVKSFIEQVRKKTIG